jgi:hypothetical protein
MVALFVTVASATFVATTVIETASPSGVPGGTKTLTVTVPASPVPRVRNDGSTLPTKPWLSAATTWKVPEAPTLRTTNARGAGAGREGRDEARRRDLEYGPRRGSGSNARRAGRDRRRR